MRISITPAGEGPSWRKYREDPQGVMNWFIDGDEKLAHVLLDDGTALRGGLKVRCMDAYINHDDGIHFTYINNLPSIVSVHYTEQP